MFTGTIILLNGVSSSGKTSLAIELQRQLAEPYLRASIDTFAPLMPPRLLTPEGNVALDPPAGSLARQGFYLEAVSEASEIRHEVRAGPVALRMIEGMHAALAALARTGNNVVFDDVLYDPAYLADYVRVLDGITVWFIGVRCPLDVNEQRERARGDRFVGHARGHYHLVHRHALYDIEVDTSLCSPAECTATVIRAMSAGAPSAFAALKRRLSRLAHD